MTKDRVIEHADGFDCIVDGRRFGTWRTHAAARVGIAIERHRAAKRKAELCARLMAQTQIDSTTIQH